MLGSRTEQSGQTLSWSFECMSCHRHPSYTRHYYYMWTGCNCSSNYWLTWHKCQRAYTIMNCPPCVVVHLSCRSASSSSVDSPLGHWLDHGNFMFCTFQNICSQYIHIKILGQYHLFLNGSHFFLFQNNCLSCLYG